MANPNKGDRAPEMEFAANLSAAQSIASQEPLPTIPTATGLLPIGKSRFMAELSLAFKDPDQILRLFGPRDQYLRRIRDTVGVDAVLKGDQLRLLGSDAQVTRGLQVFQQMQQYLEKHKSLTEDDVVRILFGTQPDPVRVALTSIDLLEKAKKVTPRTAGQAEYAQAVKDNELVFCIGPAGSGKTYLAVAMAVHALRAEQIKKIVLVRPAVEAGEELGFLPGDLLEKVKPFLRPLIDALHEMIDTEQVARYMERDIIEIVPLAYMRGRTLNNTFIILDEGQNTTITQMKMFLTRMGNGSRIVVTGDVTQIDLAYDVPSGLIDAVERLNDIKGISVVRLTGRDIVRHPLVREIVKAYDTEDPNFGRPGAPPPRRR